MHVGPESMLFFPLDGKVVTNLLSDVLSVLFVLERLSVSRSLGSEWKSDSKNMKILWESNHSHSHRKPKHKKMNQFINKGKRGNISELFLGLVALSGECEESLLIRGQIWKTAKLLIEAAVKKQQVICGQNL